MLISEPLSLLNMKIVEIEILNNVTFVTLHYLCSCMSVCTECVSHVGLLFAAFLRISVYVM